MPQPGSSRQRPFGIFNVLLLVSAAFLLFGTWLTLSELRSDYRFFGTEMGGYGTEEVVE